MYFISRYRALDPEFGQNLIHITDYDYACIIMLIVSILLLLTREYHHAPFDPRLHSSGVFRGKVGGFFLFLLRIKVSFISAPYYLDI